VCNETWRACTDVKLHLASTGYGDFLANEQPPLRTTVILDKVRRAARRGAVRLTVVLLVAR